jgi:leader peptidase (prepilin peptidase)/N-methyltransferase
MVLNDILSLAQEHPYYWWGSIAIMGLFIGSFLNVVIYRLPVMLRNTWIEQSTEYLASQGIGLGINLAQTPTKTTKAIFNLCRPCSSCPSCKTHIAFYDNIPILSFLILKGKCRNCGVRIGWTYPLVELLSAGISLLVVQHFGPNLSALSALLLSYALICISFIDLEHQLIPDELSLSFLWLGLLWPIATGGGDLHARVLGAFFGFSLLYSIYIIFKFFTGKEGMGHGDFKLLAMLGAFLGYTYLAQIVFIASALGTLVGVFLLLAKKHSLGKPMPFGPYLAIGGWVALLYGQQLNHYYWRLFYF